jgi:hypothetical protein
MALVWRRDRRVRLAASAGVLSVASTCVLAAAGLPLLTRYMLLTASVLAIFAAAGVFGWMALARGAQRTWWARFAALAVVVLLVFAPDQVHRIDRLGGALGTQARIQDDLATLVGPGLPCRPLAVANRRPIPLLALWLRIAPERIVDAQRAVPARGTYVVPRTPEVARAYILDKRDRDREIRPPPAGFRPLRANASWRASVSC